MVERAHSDVRSPHPPNFSLFAGTRFMLPVWNRHSTETSLQAAAMSPLVRAREMAPSVRTGSTSTSSPMPFKPPLATAAAVRPAETTATAQRIGMAPRLPARAGEMAMVPPQPGVLRRGKAMAARQDIQAVMRQSPPATQWRRAAKPVARANRARLASRQGAGDGE